MAFEELFTSIENGDVDAVDRIISKSPGAMEARSPDGLSPVVVAAYWGKREVLARLLATNPTLDFWEAATVGAAERVRELIAEDRTLVSGRSPDGFTALHLAVFFGHPETARLLLDTGSDVTARTTNALDNQPLHAAAAGEKTRRLECVRMLLEAGAPVNERQSGGSTPLMSSAQNGDGPVLDLLLERGADPSLKDDEGRTAADHADSAGHDVIAGRLRDLAV
jgi:ankyrin repeat protein